MAGKRADHGAVDLDKPWGNIWMDLRGRGWSTRIDDEGDPIYIAPTPQSREFDCAASLIKFLRRENAKRGGSEIIAEQQERTQLPEKLEDIDLGWPWGVIWKHLQRLGWTHIESPEQQVGPLVRQTWLQFQLHSVLQTKPTYSGQRLKSSNICAK